MEIAIGIMTILISLGILYFTGIMATLISFAGLFFTYRKIEMSSEHNRLKIEMSREHYRLSVKPILHFEFNKSDVLGTSMGVALHNSGVGPAIITKFKVVLKNENSSETIHDGWTTVFEKSDTHITEIKCKWLVGDFALKDGRIIWLLEFPKENQQPQKVLILAALINRIEIIIEYESIYGEKFTRAWDMPDNFMK